MRIYDAGRPGTGPDTFRTNGPRARFDHHRSTREDGGPVDDVQRGVWYGAPVGVPGEEPLRACVWEAFGDSPGIDLSRHLGYILVTAQLELLDLRGPAALDAGTVPQVCQTEYPHVSQAWSRYFYDNAAIYGAVDGLIWQGALSGTTSVLLYERAIPKIGSSDSFPIGEQPLLDEILRIRRGTGLKLL